MNTGSVMGGRAVLAGEMVQILVVALQLGSLLLGMLKLIWSTSTGLLLALACWIAALRVHCSPVVEGSMSQRPSSGEKSSASLVRSTVKMLTARACGASKPTITSAARRAMPTINAVVLSPHISLLAAFLSIPVASFSEGGTRQTRLKVTNEASIILVSGDVCAPAQ